MREFTIRNGKFEGTHLIFDNPEEATKHKITKIHKPWYHPEVEPGDWVVSDDGYVVQCLARPKPLVNKRHKSGQYTEILRFPQGIFAVYMDKDGNKKPVNFYAQYATLGKNSLSQTKTSKYMNAQKRLFVTYVASGLDPIHAYMKSYPGYEISRTTILKKVNHLLNDPYVREELMEQTKSLMQKIEDKIREKTGAESLSDYLANTIAELASDPNASNKDKLALIKELKQTFAVQLGLESSKKNLKEIQEASYEEVKPPQLGVKTE